MFTSTAYAQAASGAADFQSQLQSLLPLVLIIGVFYFLLIRPQQQKVKQLKAQQAGLRRGDKIVTAGGVIGSIVRVVNDEEVEVQVAENVKVRVLRSTISSVVAKTEPAGKDGGAKEAPAKDAKAEGETPAAESEADKKRRATTGK